MRTKFKEFKGTKAEWIAVGTWVEVEADDIADICSCNPSSIGQEHLNRSYEEQIANSLLQTEQGVQLIMDPQRAHRLINDIAKAIERHPEIAGAPILLTSPTSRRHLYKLLARFIPQIIVLSHNDLTSEANVKSVALVEMRNAG
jgi:flagellar biosynthesis component FlhA